MSSSSSSDDDTSAINKRESIKTIAIIAPMTLPEGYEFEATIDQRTIEVVIPKGGVQEGDILQLPFDSLTAQQEFPRIVARVVSPGDTVEAENIPDESGRMSERLLRGNRPAGGGNKQKKDKKPRNKKQSISKKVNVVPEGVWRNDLYSCCDVICSSLFWTSLFFPWILVGQLLQRMKLNFWGCHAENHKNTSTLVTVSTMLMVLIEFTLVYLTYVLDNNLYLVLAGAVFVYTLLLLLYWSYILRSTIRRGFDLPSTCCNDNCGCDDFCVAVCCTSCSSIQIARHTHDETIHPYQAWSSTGLPSSAPQVYYV